MPGQDPIARRRAAGLEGAELRSAASDRQQATVLELLSQAGDGALAFSELQDAGVEFPASVVSELELAGVPIERFVIDEGGRRAAGVRLDPAWQGETAATTTTTDAAPLTIAATLRRAYSLTLRGARTAWARRPAPWARTVRWKRTERSARAVGWTAEWAEDWARRLRALARSRGATIAHLPASIGATAARLRRSSRHRFDRRLLAPAGLIAALLAVAVLAAAELGSSGSPARRAVTRDRRLAAARPAGAPAAVPSTKTRRAAKPPPPVAVSPQLAVSLQLRGHELLEAGQSRQAAGLLTRAVAATGQRLSSCLEPVSEACLTFAYALYDLGRAVALDGRPAEAVSILERRLEIDNQRAVVATALQRARAQAG